MGNFSYKDACKKISAPFIHKEKDNSRRSSKKKSVSNLNNETPPSLRNLSFFSEDNYFSPSEFYYYQKNIENRMKDAQKNMQEEIKIQFFI